MLTIKADHLDDFQQYVCMLEHALDEVNRFADNHCRPVMSGLSKTTYDKCDDSSPARLQYT